MLNISKLAGQATKITSITSKFRLPAGLAMMMVYGVFPFRTETLPFQTLQQDRSWRWAKNSRVGRRAARQFLGPDEDVITLSGVLLPEITGGEVSIELLATLADQGKAWPLISGSGWLYGFYVVEDFGVTRTVFDRWGKARRMEFTLKLSRSDDDRIAALKDAYESIKGMI